MSTEEKKAGQTGKGFKLIISQSAKRKQVVVDITTGEIIPPSHIRDHGVHSERGPVWINPPQGSVVLADNKNRFGELYNTVGIVRGQAVAQLVPTDACHYWEPVRKRQGTDNVYVLTHKVPESKAERKKKRVQQDFPGEDLGAYVKIISDARKLPPEGPAVKTISSPKKWIARVVHRQGVPAFTIAIRV